MSIGLKGKLLTVGIIMTVVPVLLLSAVVYFQFNQIMHTAQAGNAKLADADAIHITTGVYDMLKTHNDVLQQKLDAFLKLSGHMAAEKGGFKFGRQKVGWQAVNQFSKQKTKIELSKMLLGETWLGQEADPLAKVALVDATRELTQATCTVFQRMNPAGDMLRVATNVIKKDGQRAIGTYIPAMNPGGEANPVVSALLSGRTFKGRAYVVNAWYLSVYEPIRDGSGQVIGALFVGIPQETVRSLRESISNTVIGKTGYVYILDSKGNYVISRNGERDGENIWDVVDADGHSYVRGLIAKAKAAKQGEVVNYSYNWQNSGESKARKKLVRVAYFAPWDWVIGAGTFEEEYYEEVNIIKDLGTGAIMLILMIGLASALVSVLVWLFVAKRIANPITRIIQGLSTSSNQLDQTSSEVAKASQTLAEGSSEQAASLEQTGSAMEEMASTTKRNTENAENADRLTDDAIIMIDNADAAMKEMRTSMERINSASDEMAKIISTIDEIAFQTNLLALNAAVEAARAGEAGAGFAVVADEVRNLAMRAAEAAKSTGELIEGNIRNIKTGADLVVNTDEAFGQVADSSKKVSDLVAEIASSSHEQQTGIDEINRAINEMDKVTQANAAGAEESASASEELSMQARSLASYVGELSGLVSGSNKSRQTAQQSLIANDSTPQKRLKKIGKIKPAKAIPFNGEDSGFEDFRS
jgi:methyl-accepting chemotaxis protein